MSEKTRTYVQVDLSDFAQILQVGLLWGVDRHSKARAKSFEGNHEIGIPLNIGPILARFMGLQMSHGTAYKNKLRTNSIKPTLPHLRRVLGAAPLSHASIPEDEGNHSLTPQMIVLKIAKLQALIKQRATSSISKHYSPADSKTPLLALRTCPPSSFWGFLEINNFEFFHSTILKYVQTHTCARKLALRDV